MLKSRNHLTYICFSVFEAFEKFRNSEPKSIKPAVTKTKSNLKCSTSRLVSNEDSLKWKKPAHALVVLDVGYGFKSRIHVHLLAVTPCLAMIIQLYME